MPRSETAPVTITVRSAGKTVMECSFWLRKAGLGQRGRAQVLDELLHGDVGLVPVGNQGGGALCRDIKEAGAGLGAQLAGVDLFLEDLRGGEPLREAGLQ